MKVKISNAAPALQKARWQLQTAKAQFIEVFRRARTEGPQWVTRQNKEAVVILPAEEFERLSARSRQPKRLSEFFARSPLAEAKLDLAREVDYGREVDL
jgi:prevent-host-death family protein